MNKWKIAFWVCLFLMTIITGFLFYSIIDQGVTITYMKEGYTATENDLDNIARIINETDLSKEKIKEILSNHHLYEFMDFKKDTISLDRMTIIFKDNKLSGLKKEW